MDILTAAFLGFVGGAIGSVIGWSLAAGYYAGLVRRAFGLGNEIVVRGWLHTKVVKREIDGRKIPPLR